jgi:bla regulator protein BlaR1
MKSTLAASLLSVCALAQSNKPAFEEASIKPVPPGTQCEQSMIGPMPGGGLKVECLPLKAIITWAYQVQNYQVSGGPTWVESERWNIMAIAPGKADPAVPTEYEKMSEAQRKNTMELVRARVQTLLAERFQLTLRHESREQTVYALVAGKGGPKIKASDDQSKSGFMMGGRRGVIESRNSGLDLFVQYLGSSLQRPVLNRTGLTAHYDFKLEWVPDRPAGADSSAKESNPDQSGPTIFTAIQEQLGLKLESQKSPVEMLIVERAEKPEN